MRSIEPLPSVAPGRVRTAVASIDASGRATVTRTALGVGALALAAPAAYTVEDGDTLSGIAQAQGTSVEALASQNGIDDPDHVVAGTELDVPTQQEEASQEDSTGESEAAPVGDHDVEALLERAAHDHGFSPRFVKALAWQESGWDQGQVSSAGAIGIMQVLPTTGEHISQQMLDRDLDLDDPEDNVAAGVAYLDHLWQRTGGDVEHTLAGYYQGMASVEEHGYFEDTERYIANVLALRDRF